MRTRFALFVAASMVLLGAAAPLAAQDLNGNGIADRFELPGTQPTPTLPAIHDFQINVGITPPTVCSACHNAATRNMPMLPWSGSMMGNAARDPVFWSQLDVAEGDEAFDPTTLAGGRDICLRCHMAKGWTEGRSSGPVGPSLATALRGMAMQEEDLFGVQCEVCHRLIDRTNVGDPIDNTTITGLGTNPDPELRVPTSFGNGMYVLDRFDLRRGPFTSAQIGWPGVEFYPPNVYPPMNDPNDTSHHPAKHSLFHRSGNLCGTCHDVSNPAWTPMAAKGNVQANFPIERTFTEWTNSQFGAGGESKNCQSCHMSGPMNGIGFGPASSLATANVHVADNHVHDFTGGNTWIPLVIKEMVNRYQATKAANPGMSPVIGATQAERDTFLQTYYATVLNTLYPAGTFARPNGAHPVPQLFNPTAYDDASARAISTLQRAAQLSGTVAGPNLNVRVWNMTGHKLPTGYPEGRRMWLNVKFKSINAMSGAETLLAESGEYQPGTGTLFHDFNYDNVAGPRSYDVVNYTDGAGNPLAIGRRTQVYEARLRHAATGTEFHFIRNNEIVSDDRVPPIGWHKAQFIANNAQQVIPAPYAGSQMTYEDDVTGPAAVPPVVEPTYNFDEVPYPIPAGADVAEVTLNYQSVSREYIEELVAASPRTLTFPAAGGPSSFTRADVLEHAWRTFSLSGQTHFPPQEMTTLKIALVDSDGDGLPDHWEQAHGLNPNDANGSNGRNGDPDGDGRSNWIEFQQGTNPSVAEGGAAVQPIDLALVLDFSGSMNDPAPAGGGAPKIDILKDAVDLFLHTWQQYATTGGRLGIVYFSNTVTIEGGGIVDFSALPPGVTIEQRINTLVTAIRARAAGGTTALGGGLETALHMLQTGGAGHRKQVIVFTNGMQNYSPMVRQNGSMQYVLRAEPVNAANGVFGDSGVTDAGGPAFDTPLSTSIPIHTIGIGVAQTADDRWLNLLAGISAQTNGQNQFIARAFEIEGAFLETLIASLRGFSPQWLGDRREQLAAGVASKNEEFIVDAAAKEATFIVSWAGASRTPPLTFDIKTPDGTGAAPLGRIIRGPAYMMETFYFPLAAMNGRPLAHAGKWTLTISRLGDKDRKQSERVQRSAIEFRAYAVDEVPEMGYSIFFSSPRYRAGQQPVLHVSVTDGGLPVTTISSMTADVRLPRAAFGTLLATTRIDRAQLTAMHAGNGDLFADLADAKSHAILADPELVKRLEPTTISITLFDDGDPAHGDAAAHDGVFSAVLPVVNVPGVIAAEIYANGSTPRTEKFSRRLRASTIVTNAPFTSATSELTVTSVSRAANGTQVINIITTPRDTLGNYLGPGYASRIAVNIPGATPNGPIVDRLDGSYEQPWSVPAPAAGNTVTIVIDGAPAYSGNVSSLLRVRYLKWLIWILLIILLLVLLYFLVWRKKP